MLKNAENGCNDNSLPRQCDRAWVQLCKRQGECFLNESSAQHSIHVPFACLRSFDACNCNQACRGSAVGKDSVACGCGSQVEGKDGGPSPACMWSSCGSTSSSSSMSHSPQSTSNWNASLTPAKPAWTATAADKESCPARPGQHGPCNSPAGHLQLKPSWRLS